MQNNTDSIAWAAGLFEGEGCITFNTTRKPDGKTYLYPRLQLGMTDEDVVRRFHEAVGGLGYQTKKKKKYAPHHKDQYLWLCHIPEECMAVMSLLLPYLGERRTSRYHEVFDAKWGLCEEMRSAE